jgi:hypothetical protein
VLGAGTLQGILSDYAATVLLFAPEGTMKGPDRIKPLFERMLSEFARPGASQTSTGLLPTLDRPTVMQ